MAFIATGILLQYNTEKTIRESNQSNRQASQAIVVHNLIQEADFNSILIESKIRELLITGDQNLIAGVQNAEVEVKTNLAILKNAINEKNTPAFDLLVTLANRKINFNNELINIYSHQGKEAAEAKISTREGIRLRDSIMIVSRMIEKDYDKEAGLNLIQNNVRSESVLALSRVITALSIIVISALAFMIIRRLQRQQHLIKRLEVLHAGEIEAKKRIEKISGDIHDLYNKAPCGYHSLDKDGYFIAINDTELNWLGYKREEVIGKMKYQEIWDEESAKIVTENFPLFKKKGETKERRLHLRTKEGKIIPVSLNAVAIYDNNGEYLSSRSTVFDVSKQEAIEGELKEAKKEADESARVKEQFLANMSHEIRTPINSVIGFTNLLQKTNLTDDQQQFVLLIQTAGENLLSIVNDILDISKIEAGMLRIEKNPFSLRGLANSVETMFQHRAKEKNLAFSVTINEDVPDTLIGDAVRLTQVFVNLISNAIKFTQKGGILITITSPVISRKSVRLRFSVKDTGIGIPADKLGAVFERFEQGETETTRMYGGTGLGLSIVKNLIQLQHGKIEVFSESDKGTEFIFELEYDLLPMDIKKPGGNGTTKLENAHGNGISNFEGIRVLVVEDNKMNQLLMRHTFQNWKLAFELAENGKEAIDWLQKERFDLVLLDIQMPVMNGYLVARSIRDDLKMDIPVIAMTAHALAGEREKCLSSGMNDYISKPIQEKELYELLTKYLAERKSKIDELRSAMHCVDFPFLFDMVMGNGDFLKNIINQFLKQFPGEMEELGSVVRSKNKKQIAKLSHHIQSTVSVLGRQSPFFKQLEYVEHLANNKSTNEEIFSEYNKLEALNQLLMKDVSKLLEANL